MRTPLHDQEHMKNIRLAPEYECYPLWSWVRDGLSNFDPGELPIPEALAEEIRAWAARYEATYDRSYPPDSDFSSPAEKEAFDQEGRRLWKALREALGPEYEVTYFSVLTGWESAGEAGCDTHR